MLILVMAQTIPSEKWQQDFLAISDKNSSNSIKLAIIGELATENPTKINKDYCPFLVLEGYGDYEDSTGFISELKPGSYVQHLPGLYHKIRRDPVIPWMELSFRLSPSLARWITENNLVTIDPPVYQVKNWQLQADLFLKMMKAMKANAPSIRLTLSQILAWVEEIENSLTEELTPDKLADRIKNILEAHLSVDKSEEELLTFLPYSYDYLRHLFKKETGQTLRSYREEKRFREAAAIMMISGLTVGAAAELFGYSDQFVFSRAYKRIMGSSPRISRSL